MRVLVTNQTGLGHWHPLVPLARALEAAGHEVAFAAEPDTAAAIAGNGFRTFAVGRDETATEVQERDLAAAALTLFERATAMWRDVFAGSRAASRLPDVLRVAGEWHPDLVVRDMTEFAGAIAAECLGIPQAAFQLVAYRPELHAVIEAPLNRLRAGVGLPAASPIPWLYHYLVLSPRPPSFQDPATPLPPTTHAIRAVAFNQSVPDPLPAWVDVLPDRPTVYATLGTVHNRFTKNFAALIEGLADEPINAILTVGPNVEPAQFGTPPANMHIERYIAQSLILPRCDLLVTHGGSGTVMEALGYGLPMVLMPLGADQPPNAESCARLGVGRVIPPDGRTAAAVREATREVLGEPRYRENAGRVRAEMDALPDLTHAVGLLERLATTRAPLPARG